MNKLLKFTAAFLALTILLCSCASTTTINSFPENASLYIDDSFVGKTPYQYSDTKIMFSTTKIELRKEGYYDFVTYMQRSEKVNVGAIIGGLFVWVPFLWTMEYNPVHTYTLEPIVK